jgi:glyoxylase-like metal-dependent hydrolase (beta-lactamase superfamily II)
MTEDRSTAADAPSHLTRLDHVDIRSVSVGPMDNNAYLLTCRSTGAQVLVDAAADSDRLLALVREGSGSARLDLIVTTHSHHDHVGALEDMVGVTGATTAAGAEDAEDIAVPTRQRLHHGERLVVGHLEIEVVGLRGHTPGSVALVLVEPEETVEPDAVPGRAHVFSGDSLFPGGVGNTRRDPERFAQLFDDVVERVFDRFGDDTVVHPGHGAPTTLGAERPHLDEWRSRGW